MYMLHRVLWKSVIVGAILAISGCAMVQYNDGEKVSIQSDGWYGLDSLQKPQIKPVSNMGSLKQYISIARTLTLILRPVRVFRIPSGNVSLKYERLEYCS